MDRIHKEVLGLMGKVEIDCRNEGQVVVFDLSGQLDVYNSGELHKLIDAYIGRGFTRFVMNLEDVSYLDSSTISVFIHTLQRLKAPKGKLLLAHLAGPPRAVFETAKLHEVFELHDTAAAAIESLLS